MALEAPGESVLGKIWLTGAGGFVGAAFCERLSADGIAFVKGRRGVSPETCVDVVVHLSSRVHVMRESSIDALPLYRQANTEGTLNLARQAAAAGVRRFVFVSTVKVNGEGGSIAYSESAPPCPSDPYAISKWEAEQGLREISVETGMQVVIVRPPLIYGPGVKANFLAMMRWVGRGIPLPLGAIHNQRSLVALGNLVDFLMVCTVHPAAADQTFLVSDDEDLSTTELLVRMGAALGRPARLIPLREWMFRAGASALGQGGVAQRLCGSLRVNISKAKAVLGWRPPLNVDEALRLTAADFLVRERMK